MTSKSKNPRASKKPTTAVEKTQLPAAVDGTKNDQDDAKLAAKIIDAIKEVDAATATRNEKAI